MLVIIIVIGLIALSIYIYFKFFKIPKLKNILFVDGSLGTGKSLLSVNLAIRLYRRNKRHYKIKRFFLKHFLNFGKFKNKYKDLEEPLLYSNIKLRNIKFVIVNKDLLYRRNWRFAKNSVLLLDEYSLVADQMLLKDKDINERLLEFWKLLRHEMGSHSFCIVNSQSTSDVHYSLKYVLSDYIYIHSKTGRFPPFFSLLRIQEVSYTADKNGQSIVTISQGDIEDNLKFLIVPKRYYKYYDSTCYSIFTDKLPIYQNTSYFTKEDSLKSDLLVSFKDLTYLYENLNRDEVNEVLSDKADEVALRKEKKK